MSDCHPLLLNDLILNYIFEYLELSDLKNYRMVSQLCLFKSEVEFRRRSRLGLDFSGIEDLENEQRDEILKKMPMKSLSDVLGGSVGGVPIRSVLLKGVLPWSTEEFNEFFEKKDNQVRDLKLERVQSRDEEGKKIIRGNWIHLFGESILLPLNKLHINLNLITPREDNLLHVNHRTITHPLYYRPRVMEIVIPLHLLHNIEELVLDNCCVLLSGRLTRVKKLSLLYGVDLLHYLPDVLINDFIDFVKLEDLTLNLCFPRHLPLGDHPYTSVPSYIRTVSLDMGQKVDVNLNFNTVELAGVKILNWEKCNWTVGQLIFSGNGDFDMQINERNTKMKVHELFLKKNNIRNTEVELFPIARFMPTTMEKLSLAFRYRSSFIVHTTGQQGIELNFQNVKYLSISPTLVAYLPRFRFLPNLTDLEITKFEDNDGHYLHRLQNIEDKENMPPRIRMLKIHRQNFFEFPAALLNLEVCLLVNCDLTFIKIKSVAQIFQPKTIALENPFFGEIPSEEARGPLEDPKIKMLQLLTENAGQKIVIGPFDWNQEDFKESPLFSHVDREAVYYSFQNTQGKGMTRAEFKKVTTA